MYPILFRLGPITIYSYGLMMALGFISADLLMASECRRRGYDSDYANAIVVWGAIAGLAGARVLDVIDQWSAYSADPASIIFSGSGFVWYGGFIGGLIATWLVARHYKISFLTTADMAAPALLIGQAFGRMGCQISGDGDWGLPSKLPWAMAYPHAIVGWNSHTVLKLDSHYNLVSGYFPGVRVQPTPVYETIAFVAIFALLWSLRKKINIEGRIFYLYLMLAGLERFLVEFIRINPRILWGLSQAQLVSIVAIIAGAAAWYYSGLKQSNPDTAGMTKAVGA